MAAVLLKGVATITSKGQTTLPKAVRQTLGVEAGDSICYEVEQDGRVVVTRAEENADPVVGAFLDFLERAMNAHPENLQPLSEEWLARMKDLVDALSVDADAPIKEPGSLTSTTQTG